MKITDLITLNEPLEPETIKMLFPELSSSDIAKILALKVTRDTDMPFEDMDIFENLVYVLNSLTPDVLKTEGCTPKMIWKAIEEIKKIRKKFKFSDEVLLYIKYIFNDNGYYFYPEDIGLDNPFLDKIKQRAKIDIPLEEKFLDIQTAKYKEIVS